MTSATDPTRGRAQPAILALFLAALSMLGPFSSDTIFPGFPSIAQEFSADPVAMQQIVSVYLFSYAVMSLFLGPWSDAYGRKPVIVAGTLLYALSSAGAALSQSLPMLLACRSLQGCSAGTGMIVGRAIIRDLLAGPAAQRMMAQITMIFGIAPEPRFSALSFAAAMNFGAFFLYIASAPAFVLGLLGLSATGFPWLFVPLIAGLTSGAWLSGRLAGRVSAKRAVTLGFLAIGAACASNVACSAIFPKPILPWSVLPLSIHAFGVSLCLPSVTLLALDCFPLQRGAASSVQAFYALACNALIAGVLSPLLSGSALRLALGMAGLSGAGFISWRIYLALCGQRIQGAKAGDQSLDLEVEPPL